MTPIQNNYINALLADATYVDLTPSMNADALFEALQKRMTPTLATYIAANFEVTSSINTFDYPLIGSGFDATVWRGKAGTAFAGQVFVSTRGTEPPGVDIWGADVDLATNVAARTQIIDMVNWWLREATPTNALAKQIKWDPLRTKPGDITVLEPGVVLANSVAGQGHLAGTTAVQVNGHSLGGHLASAFARIFGGETSAAGSIRTEGVSTFNSAGFNGANAEFFFSQIQGLLGTGLPSFAAVSARQTNFFAQNGINVTTNTWWFDQMGTRVGLYQEETTGPGNHSMYRITDMLALGAALEKLDPTLTLGKLNELVKVGSNNPAASLEGVFDALRRVLDPAAVRLPVGDAKDSDPARKVYHQTLAEWQDSAAFTSLAGRIGIDPCTSVDLVSRAPTDFAAMASLIALSPIVLTPVGRGNADLLNNNLWSQGAWASYYTQWQADAQLSSAQRHQGQGNYTDTWLTDRSLLLQAILTRNINDGGTIVASSTLPTDRVVDLRYVEPGSTASTTLTLWNPANNPGGNALSTRPHQLIAFGGDGADSLTGTAETSFGDHLYGGAGAGADAEGAADAMKAVAKSDLFTMGIWCFDEISHPEEHRGGGRRFAGASVRVSRAGGCRRGGARAQQGAGRRQFPDSRRTKPSFR